ncbi:HD domain-containing phosphohydrolase [uncultured Desulfosarcina sp.]|uniref:HD-GYP domain-containing protein n=1 Tax=uncultured Desulfosarcina sp. TaxID=218289 RepID=UPI0029C6977C|nr:HD domain-containing phosphohydrolase [uncultured Desulfosarcina sp.]
MRHNLTSRKRLYEQHLHTLNEISQALGEKDGYTQAHGHRVALYAMRLARRLGFSPQDIRNIGIGGLFHDVGKLALSDRIFTNRETQLPSDLQQEVRCHPLIGAAFLKNIDFLKPAVDFVLFHHEREDGNGYPFGLKAGEIPPGAKIVSIADCFDAVTTDRPYQKGQSIASAYEILREGCRRYFCEEYVETFIEEIEENGIIPDTGPDPQLADKLVRSAASCSVRQANT